MEKLRGENISRAWPLLSASSKASIFRQLKGIIEELRRIPPQHTGVANVDGGPIYDCRLPYRSSSWGPFSTIDDFHVALRNGVTPQSLETESGCSLSCDAVSAIRKLIAFHNSNTHPPVLTHGDLSSLNILIHKDKVVGIIDWETAGWLPYYWEYTTAWHANPQNVFWRDEVGHFLDPYETELEMEEIRRTYFSDF